MVFISGLFNSAVSKPDYTPSNDLIISVGKDAETSGRGLI
jgi:hypothetical protein